MIGCNYVHIFRSKAENALHSIGVVVIVVSYTASILVTPKHSQTIIEMGLLISTIYILMIIGIVTISLYKRFR